MSKKSHKFSKASIERRADFGTAMKAAALIRKTFLPHTEHTWDKTFWKRLKVLTRDMINVTGPDNLRGKLQFTDCNLNWLKIDFNESTKFYQTTKLRIDVKFENADKLILTIPEIETSAGFRKPRFADAVVIRIVCAIIHFDLKKSGVVCPKDLEMPLSKFTFPGATLSIPLQAADTSVVCLAVCLGYKWKGLEVDKQDWRLGRILLSNNFVDGKIKEYVPAKKTIATPKKPQPNNELKWDLNE